MQEKITDWINGIQNADFSYLAQREYLILAAIAGALILLLIIKRSLPRRRIRAFKGETGYVEISRHALLELVHSACEQMPEVRKPSIKIRAKRKLNLSVRIRVDGSVHLRDTASFLQNHLKDSLENNLGVEKLGRIEVLVTGIRAGVRPKVKGPEVDLNPAPKGAVGSSTLNPPALKADPAAPKAEASASPSKPAPAPAPVDPAPKKDPKPAAKDFTFEKKPSPEETKPKTEIPEPPDAPEKDGDKDKKPGSSFFDKKKKS